ncbi:hypothetical protein [Limosilactobacillus vaginalis]|uniref:hypothetical protein n=1 Tax=Limosilactobacillus vaginalis TaxID=1633 RepID=UPI002072DCB4|nr:hypothetical protein [Limosilactobacillus vaginalis]
MYDLVQPIFHTDKIRNNKLFLSRKTLLMASNERIWLGAGMYFWDNISNAKYWKRQKKKHDRYSTFSIIEASLRCNLDDLLNLTDEKTVEELQEYVEKCKKLYHHQTGIEIDLDSMKTGEIINFAYKCSELFDNGKTFKCVKGLGLYNYSNKDNFIVKEDYSKGVHLTLRGKIIYAIRDKDFLYDCREA